MSLTYMIRSLLSMLLLVAVTASQPAFPQNSKFPLTVGADAGVRDGARIYITGASERGTAITSSFGSSFSGGMMSGGTMGGLGPGVMANC